MDETQKLELLNRFTRREHTPDEVYMFEVVLCDNEIDRDMEQFSVQALKTMSQLFVGKTGIFDHDAKSSGQTARIFSTEVVEEKEKKNSLGEPYVFLKAYAYMIRTSDNENLIREIEGGIKKEVSVSCSAEEQKCSVCGVNKKTKSCAHKKGKAYGGKKAYVILDKITDAYEWSFVAVPAQINAGVTRKFFSEVYNENAENDEVYSKLVENLRKDISRLCFAAGDMGGILKTAADKMTVEELIDFKEKLEKRCRKSLPPQIASLETESTEFFKMKG